MPESDESMRLQLYVTPTKESKALTQLLGTIQIDSVLHSTSKFYTALVVIPSILENSEESAGLDTFPAVTIDINPQIWGILPAIRGEFLRHLACLEGLSSGETKLTYASTWLGWLTAPKLPIKIQSSHPNDVNRLLRFLITDPQHIHDAGDEDNPHYPYTIYDVNERETVSDDNREALLDNLYERRDDYLYVHCKIQLLDTLKGTADGLLKSLVTLIPSAIGAISKDDLDRWLPGDLDSSSQLFIGLLKLLLVTKAPQASHALQPSITNWLEQVQAKGRTAGLVRQSSVDSFTSAQSEGGLVMDLRNRVPNRQAPKKHTPGQK